jgi:hypothetical protein
MTSRGTPLGTRPRLQAALLAGAAAITMNTILLKVADLVPLSTAKGGLLRLLQHRLSAPAHEFGLASLWSKHGAPPLNGAVFQTAFHLLVGMVMAVAYAFTVARWPPSKPVTKGLVCAAAVWLLNAAVVLPMDGEGFAGSVHLTLAGIIWFAAAHTIFFLMLSCGFSMISAWIGKRTAIPKARPLTLR